MERARRSSARQSGSVWWSRIVVFAWLLGLALVRAGSPDERDPFWEARAGLENLSGTPLVRPDTWSWAPVDGAFYPNSPAWNVVLGAGWNAAGFWGLFAVTTLTVYAYLGVAYLIARYLGASRMAALAGVVGASLLAFPMLSGRATMTVQTMLLIAVAAPAWWRPRAHRLPASAAAGLAFLAGALLAGVGNWVHLSWLTLAPVVAVGWVAYGLLTPRRPAPVVGGVAGLAVGVLASPYGLAGGLDRAIATQQACLGLILEWSSPFAAGVPAQWGVVAVLSLLLGLAALVRPFVTDRRPAVDERLLLVALLGLIATAAAVAGLGMLRFVGVASLTIAPVVGVLLQSAARRVGGWAAARPAATASEVVGRWSAERPWLVVATIVAALLLPGVAVLGPVRHGVPPELAALESLPSGCRLYARAGVSGASLLVRPDVTVWFDGRADYYGRPRMLEALAFDTGVATTAAPAGATCVVLAGPASRDSRPAATARMTADPAWVHQGTVEGFDVWLRRI